MKKILFIVLMAVALSSCGATTHVLDNNYQLSHTYSTHNPIGVNINNQHFEDEYISIELLQVWNEGIILSLINNYSSTIKILWDEAAFVDHNGYSHRINHDNTSVSKILSKVTISSNNVVSVSADVIDENKVQIPTVIPAGTRVNTAIIPANNAEIPMYEPMSFADKEKAETRLIALQTHPEHPTIKLLLPIEVDGKKIEYTATIRHEFQMNIKESEDVDLGLVLLVVPVVILMLTGL